MQDILDQKTPRPLRLLLLGTAGTGKTYTVRTMLSELSKLLTKHGFSQTFVRIAAPTGTAAFTLQFGATTIHRLIQWLSPPHFEQLKELKLAEFQTFMKNTYLIALDEVSMIGRQMMGRIDARLEQGTAGRNSNEKLLGNMSCIAVDDPGQIEAMWEQQLYDTKTTQRNRC